MMRSTSIAQRRPISRYPVSALAVQSASTSLSGNSTFRTLCLLEGHSTGAPAGYRLVQPDRHPSSGSGTAPPHDLTVRSGKCRFRHR